MARKPDPNAFANLAVTIPAQAPPAPVTAPVQSVATATTLVPKRSKAPRGRGRPPVETTMRDKAAQIGIYVNPDFVWALKGYAVEARLKPHDCLLEALEQWAKRKHIPVPVRVQSDQTAENNDA